MTIKIFGHPVSTCTRKVLMTLAETNTPHEFTLVDFAKGEHKQAPPCSAPVEHLSGPRYRVVRRICLGVSIPAERKRRSANRHERKERLCCFYLH